MTLLRNSVPEQSGFRVRDPRDLIPHIGDAVLLDKIQDAGIRDRLSATVIVRPGTAFSSADGSLPGWIGVEILAQVIAAFATLASTGPARVGLLVGVRSYSCTLDCFPAGTLIEAAIAESMSYERSVGVFDGTLVIGGHVVAEGILTALRLDDPEAFLRGGAS